MTYQLTDKDPTTLEEMQKVAMNVEANLAEKRARMRLEKNVTYREIGRASCRERVSSPV